MIQSMTGYANVAGDTPAGRLVIEVRSVNNRFLDLQPRLPDALRALEPAIRESVGKRVARGKIDLRVSFEARAATELALDEAALARVAAAAARVQALVPGAAPLSVAELMRWPGVLAAGDGATAAPDAGAREMLERALDEFVASRQREGAKTAEVVVRALDAMGRLLDEIVPGLPALVAAQQARLEERLREALGAVAGTVPAAETLDRVRQEVTALGLRADVMEEMDRLRAHIAEGRRALSAGGAVGKRLDFLAQEMLREANTLGSKSTSLEQTRAAMDLKLLIEQVREQAQNLE